MPPPDAHISIRSALIRPAVLAIAALAGIATLGACTNDSGSTGADSTTSSTAAIDSDGPPDSTGDGVVPGFEPNASVVRIVDGDTIVAAIDGRDERVRLIGIDTPESVIPETPPECFGPEASKHLESLIPPGEDILIERDAEARDRFDRLLGYIYRSSDGEFVNLRMAADGFAYPLTIEPNDTHAGTISDAVALARRDSKGLWAAC